ncbi:ABC transporter substrate-binding protein [Clostridium sp. BJN0001]|uniref:ABC transporter substrate-binding protein n=1 Tax=Clostridium sp. BJN0001 TaxID=2930219 RepID=UPI001FD407C3|nr:ABC transporter substrate-binding protein [Clostridium sp. BJN0001]
MKKLISLLVFLSVIVILSFTLFNVKYKEQVSDNDKSIVKFAVDTIPDDFMNISDFDKRSQDILCAVSRGLVSKESDGKVMPDIAESVESYSDGIEYRFKIRKDAFFSDGSAITPLDIKEYFKELIDSSENGSDIKALLNIYGVVSYRENKSNFDKNVAIMVDEDELTIRLNEKDDNFLEDISKPQYRIRKNLKDWSNIDDNFSKILYSGNYKIIGADEKSIILKNTNEDSKISNIMFIKEDSSEEAMASYEMKNIQCLINPPSVELSKLSKDDNLTTIKRDEGAFIVFNKDELPLEGRKKIYNYINSAMSSYLKDNTKEFDLSEGCYFRKEKDDIYKIQQRKVYSSKEKEYEEPELITIIGEDNLRNRIILEAIKEWFETNTDIKVNYTEADDMEFNDDELKSHYDIILCNSDISEEKKDDFYLSYSKYLTVDENNMIEDKRYAELEENLFLNFKIFPVVFFNDNIVCSYEDFKLTIDGNNNVKFPK